MELNAQSQMLFAHFGGRLIVSTKPEDCAKQARQNTE
jgi:hypothetical protein